MKKAEKTFFVQNLTEELKSASSIVLVDYSGLTVKMQQELKKRLREVDAQMQVIKNTLFRIAGRDAKMPEDALGDSPLHGPTAMVITEADPIAPLQVLAKFTQKNGIPQFKVGVVEKSFQDKDSLVSLSKLPSKEVLFAQAVGAIGSPLYGLVNALQANMQDLVSVLEQASKGKKNA